MLRVMEDNKIFYQNAINQSFQNEFSAYLIEIATGLFCNIIDNIAGDRNINGEDKKFIAEFYSFGVVGLIVSWAKDGMKKSASIMIRQISTLVNDSKSFAVKRYFEKNSLKLD